MSHTALTYHLIFSTYYRQPVINIEHEKELYKYICDFSIYRGVFVRRVGGMPDHVHLLCDIPPKIALSDFVQLLKAESSKFMRVNPNFPNWQGWTAGYGAFTVSSDIREAVRRYIMNQKQHHCHHSFADEYKTILMEAGIKYDDTTPSF